MDIYVTKQYGMANRCPACGEKWACRISPASPTSLLLSCLKCKFVGFASKETGRVLRIADLLLFPLLFFESSGSITAENVDNIVKEYKGGDHSHNRGLAKANNAIYTERPTRRPITWKVRSIDLMKGFPYPPVLGIERGRQVDILYREEHHKGEFSMYRFSGRLPNDVQDQLKWIAPDVELTQWFNTTF